jgi:hypothetical protein
MEPKQWVGIDVSGNRLEVFVRPIQRMLKVANSPAGPDRLVESGGLGRGPHRGDLRNLRVLDSLS